MLFHQAETGSPVTENDCIAVSGAASSLRSNKSGTVGLRLISFTEVSLFILKILLKIQNMKRKLFCHVIWFKGRFKPWQSLS